MGGGSKTTVLFKAPKKCDEISLKQKKILPFSFWSSGAKMVMGLDYVVLKTYLDTFVTGTEAKYKEETGLGFFCLQVVDFNKSLVKLERNG